ALMGVIYAFLQAFQTTAIPVNKLTLEGSLTGILGEGGYTLLGVAFFALMGFILYRTGISKSREEI
ncbi:MAG TPA: hypothetical protein VGE15_11320, partial [Sphingobacteriaceae bacterium]